MQAMTLADRLRGEPELDMPLDYFIGLYFEKSRLWKECDDRTKFYRKLAQHAPAGGWKSTRAFAIGIGNFNDAGPRIGRCLAQLAVVMDIVEHLQESCANEIPILVAEDRFNEVDLEILRVLEIPAFTKKDGDLTKRVKIGDFCYCPYSSCDYDIFRRPVVQQPTLLLDLTPRHTAWRLAPSFRLVRDTGQVSEAIDVWPEHTHRMLIESASRDGKKHVLITSIQPKAEVWYTLYSVFQMMSMGDSLGCAGLGPPLDTNLFMFCQIAWMRWEESDISWGPGVYDSSRF